MKPIAPFHFIFGPLTVILLLGASRHCHSDVKENSIPSADNPKLSSDIRNSDISWSIQKGSYIVSCKIQGSSSKAKELIHRDVRAPIDQEARRGATEKISQPADERANINAQIDKAIELRTEFTKELLAMLEVKEQWISAHILLTDLYGLEKCDNTVYNGYGFDRYHNGLVVRCKQSEIDGVYVKEHLYPEQDRQHEYLIQFWEKYLLLDAERMRKGISEKSEEADQR